MDNSQQPEPLTPQSFNSDPYGSDDFEHDEISFTDDVYIVGRNVDDQLRLTDQFPGDVEEEISGGDDDDWVSIRDESDNASDSNHNYDNYENESGYEDENEYYEDNFELDSLPKSSSTKNPNGVNIMEEDEDLFPVAQQPVHTYIADNNNNNLAEFSSLTFATTPNLDDYLTNKMFTNNANNNNESECEEKLLLENSQVSPTDQSSTTKPKVHWQPESNPPKRRLSTPGQRGFRPNQEHKGTALSQHPTPRPTMHAAENNNNSNNNNPKKPNSTPRLGLVPRPPSSARNVPSSSSAPATATATSSQSHATKFQKVAMPEIHTSISAMPSKVTSNLVPTPLTTGELQLQLKIANKKLALSQQQNQQLLEKLDSLSSVEAMISNYQYELKQKQAKMQDLIRENNSLKNIARYQGKFLLEKQEIKDNEVDHHISQEKYIDVLTEHIRRLKEKVHEQKQLIQVYEKREEQYEEAIESYKKKFLKRKSKKKASPRSDDGKTVKASPTPAAPVDPVSVTAESVTIEKLQKQRELQDKLHQQEMQHLKKQNQLFKSKLEELQQELNKRELLGRNQIIQLKSLKQKYEELLVNHQQLIAGSALFQSDTNVPKKVPPPAMIIHPSPPPIQNPPKIKQAILAGDDDEFHSEVSPGKQSFFITSETAL